VWNTLSGRDKDGSRDDGGAIYVDCKEKDLRSGAQAIVTKATTSMETVTVSGRLGNGKTYPQFCVTIV
jgi:hypothetical protein